MGDGDLVWVMRHLLHAIRTLRSKLHLQEVCAGGRVRGVRKGGKGEVGGRRERSGTSRACAEDSTVRVACGSHVSSCPLILFFFMSGEWE